MLLGMVMEDTQGEELCHEHFVQDPVCVPQKCANQCTAKWGARQGRGACGGGPGMAKDCLCTFSCQNWFFFFFCYLPTDQSIIKYTLIKYCVEINIAIFLCQFDFSFWAQIPIWIWFQFLTGTPYIVFLGCVFCLVYFWEAGLAQPYVESMDKFIVYAI